MLKSPQNTICASGSAARLAAPERFQPAQLVVEVRITHSAAVGHVHTPHLDTRTQRTEGSGLGGRWFAPLRDIRKPGPDVVQADPGGDGDAVPLREPDMRDLVTEVGER